MKIRSLINLPLGVLATLVLGIITLSQPSQAATCAAGGVTFTLDTSSGASCFAGNDLNTIDSAFVMFGLDGWVLGDTTGNAVGDGTIVFTDEPTSGESNPGTWAIAGTLYEQIVVVLKQANAFAAFLIPEGITSGTWSTVGPGGSTMGLSHASLYHNGLAIVPVSPAILFLGTALLGLGALGRRRKTTRGLA